MVFLRIAVLSLLGAGCSAQPFVYYRGAVNAASYLPPGLPNAPIARGSMFSVFGRALGPAAPQQVSAFPLQTTFAEVSVSVSQGTATSAALPVFVSAGQLNVIMPSDAPLGQVALRVTFSGQTSNPIPVTVADSSVGLFSVNGGGFGPGIVQNFLAATDVRLNSLAASVKPGAVAIAWGTGLGAAPFPDASAPTPLTIETGTEVFVGGKKANVLYAGRSSCCSSIDQISFAVPADAPAGCYVPVAVRTKGRVVSNTVTMAIDPAGAPCRDASNPLSGQFRSGGRTALAMLGRENLRVERSNGTTFDVIGDVALATFRQFNVSDFHFNMFTALPPLGTCTVYAGAAQRAGSPSSQFAPQGPQINVGSPLTIGGTGVPSATIPAAPGFEGSFLTLLASSTTERAGGPGLLFNNGPFSITAPGTGFVAPFRALLDRVTPVSWTNRDAIREIVRTNDLPLTWTAAPGTGRGVLILGLSNRGSSNASAWFACIAPGTATNFTVPNYVLTALPPSDSGRTVDQGRISLVNIPLQSSGTVPGFDNTFLGVSAATGKTGVVK